MIRNASLLFLSLFVASPSFAQSLRIQAGQSGVSMQADQPADEPHRDGHGHHGGGQRHGPGRQAPAVETIDAPGYRLSFEANPDGETLMKVLSPEGAQCQVWDGRRLIAEDDLPLSFPARAERFYRIIVKSHDGQIWEKKLAAKRGKTASLWVMAAPPPPPPPPVVVQEPPPPPPHHHEHPMPAGPMPMFDADFASLTGAIRREDFSNQQLQVLETAVASPSAWFTVGQVGQLVDLFTFGNDKVKAVELVVGRIVDRQNAYQLYSHFEFSSEKEKVKRLLGQ
jgi:hypothetical protein